MIRIITLLIITLAIIGFCGFTGAVIILGAGYWLSRVAAFGVTPFQAALVCIGVLAIVAIVIRQLLGAFLLPSFRVESDEEREDDSPARRVRRPEKRR